LIFRLDEAFPMQSRERWSAFRAGVLPVAGVSVIFACLAFSGTARAQVKGKSKAETKDAKAKGVAAVLEKMRTAAGMSEPSERPAEVLIEGKVERNGVTADYSLRSASTGMFLQSAEGPLPSKIGFNGKDYWSTDFTGMPLRLALHDLDRNRLLLGMQTGQWLSGADGITLATSKTKPGRDEVMIEVKQGRLKAELHVSRTTWLPKSLNCAGVSGPENWTFADYREFGGLKVPGTVTIALGDETEIYRVGSIRPAPRAPASVYDVVGRPNDTEFDAVASPGLVVKRAMTGHILVRPKIDGQEVGWFVFDSSAGANVIDATVASNLKLERLGSTTVTSVTGNEPSSIFRAKSLALGPMTIARPLLVTMKLANV
jgi:Aspartyl protease